MAESRVEAWDRLERENADLRRALEPFARVAVTPLRFANVRYGTDTDPERQTFQTPTMHRAFNRAAEVLRAAKDGVGAVQAPSADLHAAIMNLPSKWTQDDGDEQAYKRGHRDARHAAAELALGVAGVQPQQAVQCAFCERPMIAGSECLTADRAAACEVRTTGVDVPDGEEVMSATNGTATTWGKTVTLDDLKRLERELAAMPKALWTLIAPDGRAWQSAEPRELLPVLAGACYPLFPAGVGVVRHETCSHQTPMDPKPKSGGTK